MSETTRRGFIQTAAAAGVAVSASSVLRAAGANERIVVGLIGCGGRGGHDAGLFKNVKNVEIAWVCDPDEGRRAKTAEKFGISAGKSVTDMRKLLDDKSVDAVIVTTPDHWHSPAAILACDAGKHVYVEKPCSHNVREGRLLVEAARRNKRLVQHGTQSRSTTMMQQAVKALREGIIGTVLVSKAWNIQRRGPIGHGQPGQPPADLNYDLWVGPAAMVPYQANRCHGGWHWWYDFGTGDMGNDGVHDVDYARWGLGVETHPSLIVAAGGKFVFDDDQQFPDTQQVTFEYAGDGKQESRRMLIYEQRLWSTNYPMNVDSGVEFYGTKGQMFLSRRGKIQIWGDRNQKIDSTVTPVPQDDAAHVLNFCEAIRSGAPLNAEIDVGHHSTVLCHLGNIAVRLGRSLSFDPAKERFHGDDEANRLLTRTYREGHWAVPRDA